MKKSVIIAISASTAFAAILATEAMKNPKAEDGLSPKEKTCDSLRHTRDLYQNPERNITMIYGNGKREPYDATNPNHRYVIAEERSRVDQQRQERHCT